MNYQRQYELLIEKARQRGTVEGYRELHHIVPRCMGGSDEKENLVDLTAREHFVAHRLLWMWHRTPQMAYAWRVMSWNGPGQQRSLRSKDYQHIKEAIAAAGQSEEIRRKISEANTGRKYGFIPKSEEHRKKIGEANRRRVWSAESRKKLSDSLKNSEAAKAPKTDSHRQKISASLKGKPFSEEHRQRLKEAWARRKMCKGIPDTQR